MKSIIFDKERLHSLERRHPWIYSRGIEYISSTLLPGDILEITDTNGNFIARGYYEGGHIAIRILTFSKDEQINSSFWKRRIHSAYILRKELGFVKSRGAYRLINGEGDGIPGLNIDIYGTIAVIQAHTFTIHKLRNEIFSALLSVYNDGFTTVYYTAPDARDIRLSDKFIADEVLFGSIGELECLIAEEEGIKFHTGITSGSNTLYPLDQRDNRIHLRNRSIDRNVLSLYSRSGGFSLAALRGGANMVTSVDSSSKAISLLEENLSLNFDTDFTSHKHQSIVGDSFKYLQELNYGIYDIMVLDPPAFAKRREVIKNGIQGYRKLNTEAIRKIAPNGLIYTFSCSQIVSAEQFRKIIFTAALNAGRNVSIVAQLSQSAHHPISIYHPEGDYLKGLLLFVK